MHTRTLTRRRDGTLADVHFELRVTWMFGTKDRAKVQQARAHSRPYKYRVFSNFSILYSFRICTIVPLRMIFILLAGVYRLSKTDLSLPPQLELTLALGVVGNNVVDLECCSLPEVVHPNRRLLLSHFCNDMDLFLYHMSLHESRVQSLHVQRPELVLF